MINDFEEGFENIRSWMDTVEISLQRPLTTQNSNEIRVHQQSLASIEVDIEKHSSIISSLLALGRNVLNETESRPRNIETLSRSVETLEERWIALKELLRKRKLEFVIIFFSPKPIFLSLVWMIFMFPGEVLMKCSNAH